jgi:SWI/SNF-related matrix-associated actin-dependent regulator of chromatin subfamily A3
MVGEILVSKCGHVYCAFCASYVDGFPCKHPDCKKTVSPQTVYKESDLRTHKEKVDAPLPPQKYKPSSKFDAVLKYLSAIPFCETTATSTSTRQREKALVFSQWTSCLDMLEPFVKEAGLRFTCIDGTMAPEERDKALQTFKKMPKVHFWRWIYNIGGILGVHLGYIGVVVG